MAIASWLSGKTGTKPLDAVVAAAAARGAVAAGSVEQPGGGDDEVAFADRGGVVVVVGEDVDHAAFAADAAGVGRVAAPHGDRSGERGVAVLGEEPDVPAAARRPAAAGGAPFDGDLAGHVDQDRAVGRGELHVDPPAVGAVAAAAHHDRAAAGVDLARDVDAAAAGIGAWAAVEQASGAGRRHRPPAAQIDGHRAGDVDAAGARLGRDGTAGAGRGDPVAAAGDHRNEDGDRRRRRRLTDVDRAGRAAGDGPELRRATRRPVPRARR